MSKPLTPAQAKLRARAIREFGRAMVNAHRALRHTMHNRRKQATRCHKAALLALWQAEKALSSWT